MDSATHAGDTLRAAGDTMAAGDTADTTGQPDIIHQQREVAPGIDRDPPPYPADSERVWVEERPSHDSVPVPNATLGDTAQSSQ